MSILTRKLFLALFTLVAIFQAVALASAQLPQWHITETWTINPDSSVNQYYYTLHGPLLESGTAYTGIINVTASFDDASPYVFSMSNGETYTFSSQHRAVSIYWNLTSSYTYSRQLSFGTDLVNDAYLYVGGSTDILAQYGITVTDFAGLSNATVETVKNVLGIERTVERKPLDILNTMNFWLIQYTQYTLKVVSDEATFSWNLPADTQTSKSFFVTQDMLDEASNAQNITVTASRVNSTYATFYYNDPDQLTTQIQTLLYVMNRTGQYVAFSQTTVGYSQSLVLTLDSSMNYLVKCYATRSGATLSWQYSLPMSGTSDIWGSSFAIFGDWTFLLKNGLGMFIVLMVFSVGEWKDSEWFFAAGILIAAFFVAIGMMSIPWLGISMGMLVVVLMLIAKGKKEVMFD